ncbi:hypothetical protein [Phenylobacterium sp.]|uniref:hypothetical protein n=1 Tax=Phenylobacterium sp. TaxID=1871053 RepID=UPI002F3FB6AA
MARNSLLGLMMGLGLLLLGGAAAAQCCAPPTPPACCAPPPCCTPPPPPPPSTPPCCTPGHNVTVPGVNVFVAGAVTVNAQARAQASSVAGAGASSVVFFGGGGGGGYAPPMATGVIQGLNVGGGMKRTAYQATRSKTTRVIIQAVCIDDRFVAHPASQVRPEREVDDLYEGELYRCIAGTRMQYTVAEFLGKIDFSGGKTMVCAKGEALYHAAGGGARRDAAAAANVSCRPQKPARDCNERSLLRRFGAGIKILTMTIVESYTAYREESSESVVSSMSLDGGVGGIAY